MRIMPRYIYSVGWGQYQENLIAIMLEVISVFVEIAHVGTEMFLPSRTPKRIRSMNQDSCPRHEVLKTEVESLHLSRDFATRQARTWPFVGVIREIL